MPVNWFIDSRRRVVEITAEGRVTRPEMEEYLEAVSGAGANGYAKIFDATRGELGMTNEDMSVMAATFRQMYSDPHGPLAIVLQQERQARLLPVLGALAAADRPLGLLTTRLAAKRWITVQTTNASGP